MSESLAKQSTVTVSAAIKNLNDAIIEASDHGVEVTISTPKTWVGPKGSRSTLVSGDFKLILRDPEGEGEG